MNAAQESGAAVVEEIVVDASPERVFDALVDPAQLGSWWGSSDMYTTEWSVDLRVGGEFLCTASMGPERMTVRGRYLHIDRPRRLDYTWNASWDPSGETLVRYDLIPEADRTRVRVTQTGFTPDADRSGYGEGWQNVLGWLAAHFPQGSEG